MNNNRYDRQDNDRFSNSNFRRDQNNDRNREGIFRRDQDEDRSSRNLGPSYGAERYEHNRFHDPNTSPFYGSTEDYHSDPSINYGGYRDRDRSWGLDRNRLPSERTTGERYVSSRGLDDGRIEFDRNRDFERGLTGYSPLYSQDANQRQSSYGSRYDHNSWTAGDQMRESASGVWQSVKNFFGKGPKGYKRSGERIKEDVNEALYSHPEIDASEIEVDVQGTEVTLKGTIADRRMKRLAEDCAHAVMGVDDVRNELRIQSMSKTSEMGTERERTSGRSEKASTKNTSSDRMM